MSVPELRYPIQEIVRRGEEIYDTAIRPRLQAADQGKYVVVDIETGEWEIDDDEQTASRRLRARAPSAQAYVKRVRYAYVRHFGPRRSERSQ